jgi:hypothetical protein
MQLQIWLLCGTTSELGSLFSEKLGRSILGFGLNRTTIEKINQMGNRLHIPLACPLLK